MIIDEQLFEAKDKEIAELRAALDEAKEFMQALADRPDKLPRTSKAAGEWLEKYGDTK